MTPSNRRQLTTPYYSMNGFPILGLLICCCCLLQVISSCRVEERSRYPETLEKAIDLFYFENQNDSLLILLDAFPPGELAEEQRRLAEILRAGAMAESGKADSAQLYCNRCPVTRTR